jgi:archaellum biogenesis ATPase FlaH
MTDTNEQVIPTGYTELDKLLDGGFKKGELIIIKEQSPDFSDPSNIAINIAENMSAANKSVLFLSFASPEEVVLERMKTFWKNCVRKNKLHQFTLEDYERTFSYFKDSITFNKATDNIKCVFIDGLNYFRSIYDDEGDYVESYVSAYVLKKIAKNKNIPIVATINNEAYLPNIERIDQIADIIISLSNRFDSEIQITVDKRRPVSITLKADWPNWRFENI